MEVRILTGIKTDQDGLSDVSRSKKENQKVRHARSEDVEGGVSNDESGGCELEQMTMKTDNEPSLGALVDDLARQTLRRMAVEHSPAANQCVASTLSAPESSHGGYHVLRSYSGDVFSRSEHRPEVQIAECGIL